MPVTIRTDGLVDQDRLRLALSLLREAGDAGITKLQMARRMGCVSSRTVDRAVTLLEDQGARIAKPRRGRPAHIHFVLEKGPSWDEHLSPEARTALRLAALHLGQGGTACWQEKVQALSHLVGAALSTRDRRMLGQLHRAARPASGPVAEPAVLEPLLKALEQGRALELEASDGEAPVEVVPCALVHDLFSGGAMLLAHDTRADRPATFSLARLGHARVLRAAHVPRPERIEQAASLQIGGWTGGEPFTVVARVKGADLVRSLESTPPPLPGFHLTPAASRGEATLAFQADHPAGASRWLLQFGEALQVQEPGWLKTELRQRLEAALRQYQE